MEEKRYYQRIYPVHLDEEEAGDEEKYGLWIVYIDCIGGDRLIRISGGKMVWKRFLRAEVTFGAEEFVSVLRKGILRNGAYTLSDDDGWHKATFFCENGMITKVDLLERESFFQPTGFTMDVQELSVKKIICDIKECLRRSALSK